MKVTGLSVYRGPNVYAPVPVIRFRIDLEGLEDWPTGRLGAPFVDGLLDCLPGLGRHGGADGGPADFARRLRQDAGVSLAHVMQHAALEVQGLVGAEVGFGATRAAGSHGVYDVVYEYQEGFVGLAAGRLALALIHHLVRSGSGPADGASADYDFARDLENFVRFAEAQGLDQTTLALVHAAEARGIPWFRVHRRHRSVQLGYGRFQKRVLETVTSGTGHIGAQFSKDKAFTAGILGDLLLPVPRQRLAGSAGDAVRAAEDIGYPVVVKPSRGGKGMAIGIGLTDAEEVGAAFAQAAAHGPLVVVERFIEGDDHRMLVVDGALIAVARRVPAHVAGDGVHTIEELIDEVNRDPRRGIGFAKLLVRLDMGKETERMLAGVGYTGKTVPSKGEIVTLRRTANIHTGGTAVDMSDRVHPDNRDMAVRAAEGIGLDVAGIDFLTTDISRSYRDVGGAICEVNASPGLRPHWVAEGNSPDVVGPILDMLFPPGTSSHFPIAAITGTNGKTTTCRMVAHIFRRTGNTVGLVTSDGIYVDDDLIVAGDRAGGRGAHVILRHPRTDMAVLETARGGLIRSGMGYGSCDVGAVLNVATDHLGMDGVDTLEQMAEVKRVVVQVARDTAVLNADDELCLAMADHTKARHVCYVTMDAAHPLVARHIGAGGRAVVLAQGENGPTVTVYDQGVDTEVVPANRIPAALEGLAAHNVENALFATAIAYGLGAKPEDIGDGLSTFACTFALAPGRMNIFDGHPFKVILDYAHNAHGVSAMCRLVEQLETTGRRLCVLESIGNRRDEHYAEVGRAAAGAFNHYICTRDDDLRGRGPDEVPGLLRDGLIAAGVAAECITTIPDEEKAVAAALDMAGAGDLVLILASNAARSWKQITEFGRGADRARAP